MSNTVPSHKVEPSLEMDLKVAHLMNWAQLDENTWRDNYGAIRQVSDILPTEDTRHHFLFKPSRLENDSGLVWDRLVELGYTVTVHTGMYPYPTPAVRSWCIVRRPDGEILNTVGMQSRSLALCDALLSVGHWWKNEQP